MSKKEEEKVEAPLEQDVVDVPVEAPKKKKNKKTDDLQTLYELVTQSEIDTLKLIVPLSDAGYLNQFYDEEKRIKNREYVEPTFSVKEFEKIIRRLE